MNNSINNINFKGQLITKLSGRHNIMSRVSNDFAKKTAHIPGKLTITRGNTLVNPKTIILSNGDTGYVISDYANFMGNKFKNANEITDDVVSKISDTFVNIFNALDLEKKFVRKNQELIQNINRIRRIIDKNEIRLNVLKESNDQQAIKLLTAIIESSKKKLAKLEAQYNPKKIIFLEQADKFAEKDPELKVWRNVVEDIESYV